MQQGSRMLQVVGILMLVYGAVELVITLMGILGMGVLIGVAAGSITAGIGVLTLFSLAGLLGAIIMLVAGILGAKNWNQPQKAGSCVAMGVIIVILNALSGIGDFMNPSTSLGVALFGLALGLLFPVLYLVGALKLKSMAA